jgi:hypothetical protein
VHSGALIFPSRKSKSCAPLSAERTRAFQIRKFKWVSFFVMGCSVGTLINPRLEEAISVLRGTKLYHERMVKRWYVYYT